MKKSILSVLLLCATPSLLPVTTGLSCFYNPETKQKVVIIRDNYYGYKGSPDLVADQTKELTRLVDILASGESSSTILCECSAVTFSALQKGAPFDEVLLTIPKLFATQGSKQKGKVTFDIFGRWNKNYADHIVKTCYFNGPNSLDIVDTAEAHPIQNPEITYQQLTVGLYLGCLANSYRNRVQLLDALPAQYAQLVKQIKVKLTRLYNGLGATIQEILSQNSFANIKELHVIYLLESQLRNWNYDLLQKINKLVAYQEEIDIFSQIVAAPSEQVIIHGANLPLLNYWLYQAGFVPVEQYGQSAIEDSEDQALALSVCDPVSECLPAEEDPYIVEFAALEDSVDTLVREFLNCWGDKKVSKKILR